MKHHMVFRLHYPHYYRITSVSYVYFIISKCLYQIFEGSGKIVIWSKPGSLPDGTQGREDPY